MPPMRTKTTLFAALSVCTLSTLNLWAQDEEALAPIEIATIERDSPVDFSKEIYPLFKKSCIACHNSSKARGKLNLESPKAMIKGGSEGPAVVPGKADESLLLILAAHQEDPVMPPEGNKANASPFTPEELGLIKLWIDEGAKGESTVITATPTNWVVPRRTDYPVYHLAMSPNDDLVAASRGNRVFLYDLRKQGAVGELIDPELAKIAMYEGVPVAHRDFVQSLAFSNQGWIASGGFRNVKLWQQRPPAVSTVASMPEAVTAMTVTADGQWAASADKAGHVRLWKPDDSGFAAVQAKVHDSLVSSVAFSQDGAWLVTGSDDGMLKLLKTPDLSVSRSLENSGPVRGAVALPEAKLLIAGADDGNVRAWAFQEAEGEPRVSKVTDKAIAAVVNVAGQPNHVLIGGADGVCREWHVGESREVRTFNHEEPIRRLTTSPDGRQVLTLAEKTAKLWQREDGKLIQALDASQVQTRAHQLAERDLAAANKLVATRKKRLEDADKAWKAEVEKAKKAAVDELAAEKTFHEKDRASIEPRLAVDVPRRREAELKAKVEEAKQAVAAAEQAVQESGDFKAMVAEFEKTNKDVATIKASLDQERKTVAEAAAVKDKVRQSLETLRQVQGRAKESAAQAITATETVLAGLQADESAARVRVGAFTSSLDLLQAKASELGEMVHRVDNAKAALAKAEEALKPAAEELKRATDAANKADNEREAAAKAFKQASENRELALRLSNRAAEAHGRAATALVAGEEVLKRQTAAVEAAKKLAEAKPTLTGAQFACDSASLAIILEDGQWQLWTNDGEFLRQHDAANSKATALASLAVGSWLVGNAEKQLQVQVDAQSWERRRVIGAIEDPKSLVDRVTSVAFNPTGTLIATGSGSPSRSGELKIWRVSDGALLVDKPEAHSDTIVGLDFSPDGRYLATASSDRFARVFRVDDGEMMASFEGHTSHVLDVSWRADGLVLATCGADNVIKLWDFEEKRQIKTIDGYNKEITSVAFLDVDETLVTSSGDKSVRLGKDRLDGKEFVYTTALSQDGALVVAGSQDSKVRVWTAKDKKLVKTFDPPPAP